MKKYNLSKIMKRAWELVKKASLSISEGLKKAWREAKGIAMRGTEKQIAWATNLMQKMHKEFTACKEIAPVEVHQMFDTIENILNEGYAGDVIELLSSNKKEGQDYFVDFSCALAVSATVAAKKIKAEVK